MALKQVMAAYKGCVYAFVCLTDGSLYVANVNQTNPMLTLCLHVCAPTSATPRKEPIPCLEVKGNEHTVHSHLHTVSRLTMHAGVMWKEDEGSGIDAVNVTLVRQLVLV